MMIKNAIKHFKLISTHKYYVFKNCWKANLYWQGIVHDLSKYSPTEFFESVKFFTGDKSPIDNCKAVHGWSKAWMHHKGRNRHHFEYWTDYIPHTKKMMPIKMPKIFVLEMFCDRVAASKIYQGDSYTDSHPLEYFLRSKGTRFIHPETSDYLEKLLVMLRDKGEEATFRYIRKTKKDNY